MAVYKVPQDVEAEDKLIGPFSFRQFIYLIVAALSAFLAYGLSRLFIGFAFIPLPITLFFLILALPLKKDQPMETYLTAIVRFLLKPKTRLWIPEGEFSLVEITAPKVDEGPLTKDFSGVEASQRLQYLSQIVDTGGWASRGLQAASNLHMSDTLVAEAQTAEDMFDTSANVSQHFSTMISQSDQARKEAMIQTMVSATQAPTVATSAAPVTRPVSVTPTPRATAATPAPYTPVSDDQVAFNPYPSSIHQKVISPHPTAPNPPVQSSPDTTQLQKQAQASSDEPLSPDIMRLATSKDLSISTIAREAKRLEKKHLEEGEVVVSLR